MVPSFLTTLPILPLGGAPSTLSPTMSSLGSSSAWGELLFLESGEERECGIVARRKGQDVPAPGQVTEHLPGLSGTAWCCQWPWAPLSSCGFGIGGESFSASSCLPLHSCCKPSLLPHGNLQELGSSPLSRTPRSTPTMQPFCWLRCYYQSNQGKEGSSHLSSVREHHVPGTECWCLTLTGGQLSPQEPDCFLMAS